MNSGHEVGMFHIAPARSDRSARRDVVSCTLTSSPVAPPQVAPISACRSSPTIRVMPRGLLARRAEAVLQVGVADRAVEEAERPGVEQLPAGPLEQAQGGAGQAAAEADAGDAEGEERT